MMRAVPVVSVSIVSRRNPQPGSGTSTAPLWLRMLSSPTAMPKDWIIESPMVP